MQIRSPALAGLALVPWDPESPSHIDRLIQQRVDCGWHAEMPDGPWREAQRQGKKCIYWLVLPQFDDDAAEKLRLFTSSLPTQSSPLLDTCASLRGIQVQPTGQDFVPVGHIALEFANRQVDHFNMDMPSDGVIWIKSLFIVKPLQSAGLGRAAMDTLEAMATSAPLSAQTLMLDTMHGDDHRKFKGVQRTNQDWYERRGYRVIHTQPWFYLDEPVPDTEDFKGYQHRTVFMRKDLASR